MKIILIEDDPDQITLYQTAFKVAGLDLIVARDGLEGLAKTKKEKPDFILTSFELQKAFEENETIAIEKYVNKIIEVTGTVLSVTTGEGNVTNISLETDSSLSSVICTLASGSGPAVPVPGKEIRIRGECSGFLMDVLLNNCVIIE